MIIPPFFSSEKLTDSGRSDASEVADGLFIYLDGKLIELPRKDPDVPEFNGFVKQACFPGMGELKHSDTQHFVSVSSRSERGLT